MMQIFEALDQSSRISLDQHFCDLTILVLSHQLHSGHHRGHSLYAAIKGFQ